MIDDSPFQRGGELMGTWRISGKPLSRAYLVTAVEEVGDPETELRMGTADVACETENAADEVEALVGVDDEIYLKGPKGEVYLITLDGLIGRWKKSFPPGSVLGEGNPENLRRARPVEAFYVRSYSWHERPGEWVETETGQHWIGSIDSKHYTPPPPRSKT